MPFVEFLFFTWIFIFYLNFYFLLEFLFFTWAMPFVD